MTRMMRWSDGLVLIMNTEQFCMSLLIRGRPDVNGITAVLWSMNIIWLTFYCQINQSYSSTHCLLSHKCMFVHQGFEVSIKRNRNIAQNDGWLKISLVVFITIHLYIHTVYIWWLNMLPGAACGVTETLNSVCVAFKQCHMREVSWGSFITSSTFEFLTKLELHAALHLGWVASLNFLTLSLSSAIHSLRTHATRKKKVSLREPDPWSRKAPQAPLQQNPPAPFSHHCLFIITIVFSPLVTSYWNATLWEPHLNLCELRSHSSSTLQLQVYEIQ